MTTENVLTIKHGDSTRSSRMRTTEQLAGKMPKLRLPRMAPKARAAFNSVLEYEMPPGNSSTRDVLRLAEARGFAAHPADWIPFTKGDSQFASLYQPNVDWLSENRYTPYWEGNSLTRFSCSRFNSTSRRRSFRTLCLRNRAAIYDIMLNWSSDLPAAIRLELLDEVDASGSFYGNYPWHVPILRHFLADKSAKVRSLAEEKLKRMGGLENEEDHAAILARYIKFENGMATYLLPPKTTEPSSRHFESTTFDLLSKALGLHPHDLARCWDLEYLNGKFMYLAVSSADPETRSIIASRLLDANVGTAKISLSIFRGLPRALWERGLHATFQSEYIFSFLDFLDKEIGTLDASLMGEIKCYQWMEQTVIAEIKDRKLPVNTSWDPLRILGLGLNQDAAAKVLSEAIALGMHESNRRLSMLKLNLAL